MAIILGRMISTALILRKKECTGELGNAKRPGRPQKTPVGYDGRIVSMVKRNPITAANQANNAVSISTPLHESKG